MEVIEDFFGVYLLYCKNPKFLGRTYVGYTVDPNRRIGQHNKGRRFGGAVRTSNRGPWSMALIVHGFPNDIAALRFEWAWQHPTASRRLNHIPRQKPKEKPYDYRLRVLSEMLLLGPWNRLPLTIRWLDESLIREFSDLKLPPIHMPIAYGNVISKKVKSKTESDCRNSDSICSICGQKIESKILNCLSKTCDLNAHVVCLSKSFLSPGEYVPVLGKCPICRREYLWNDFVRKSNGCYENLNITINCDDFECFSSDSE